MSLPLGLSDVQNTPGESVSWSFQMPPRDAPGTKTTVVEKCFPLDCYAQCREKDKETQKMCKEANKIHVAKMKALGCNGTSCRTGRLGKSCRKVKQPKRCPPKKKKVVCKRKVTKKKVVCRKKKSVKKKKTKKRC